MAYSRPTQTAHASRVEDDPRALAASNSVRRALSILALLNDSPSSLSFSDIREKLALPKSTTSLLLSTLETLGYLTRDGDSRRYWINLQAHSPKFIPVNHLELSENAIPVLKAISSGIGLTSFICVLDEDQVLFLRKAEGPNNRIGDIYPGRRASAQCTAVGKVLLASLDNDEQARFLARHQPIPYTNRTVTSKEALVEQLNRVRKLGYAIDDREESYSIRCLGIPVLSGTAAIGVTGSISEIRPDNLASIVTYMRRMAQRIKSEERSAFPPAL